MCCESKPTMHLCGAHPAVATARGELDGILGRRAAGERLRGVDVIHLGLFEELSNRLDLIRRGLVNLHNVTPGQDAFECLRDGGTLYLLGSTPREDRPRTLKCVMSDGAALPCAAGYPIYRRDHMKAGQVPLKTVERYVAPRVV